MRDGAGNIVGVHTTEPWGLHVLTATGSNAGAASPSEGDRGHEGDDFGLRAPPEPVIAQLSPVAVELLIERYIRFETEPTLSKPSYAAALQRPFIDALIGMGADASKMPVGRAINTAPLVAINGTVIAGTGLDRNTGLIHRIEPALLACLPTTRPTKENVQTALHWLLNTWLVDVKADASGKFLVLMLCLSLIERVLLKERPAWFVVAGQRGGGKTTLVNMMIMAIFGRSAAAAAWSDSEEERRKALFSYLRQAVAALCWDNIPRGAQISSACIEKALTSAEVSDRVLGESEFENAPGGTVQIFTGNSIAPKGDMCSRSFAIVINVDRPDPENRPFVHSDPIGWTEQHRLQILINLYTMLLYGCQNRPAGQVAKTRFKDWWKLCGWPIEHAASLIGESVDCLALLKAGENDDDETAAAQAMLSTLRAEYGDKPFTAKAIVEIIEAGDTSLGKYPPTAARNKADRLLDAFGEMLGRRLDRPTAGSIGKLLNNRLVERPTRIDANIFLTLKRYEKENTGQYFVKEGRSDIDPNDTTRAPQSAETMSPMSPNSPDAPINAKSGRGDGGDRGDVSGDPAFGDIDNADDITDVPAHEEALVE